MRHPLGNLGAGGAGHPQSVGDVVVHGLPREQAEMLEHHRHAGDRLGHPLAAAPDFAAIDRQQAVDAAQQRGLAAARWADDGDDLALAELEVDAAEHFERAVPLGKSADADARRGPASVPSGPVQLPRGRRGHYGVSRACVASHVGPAPRRDAALDPFQRRGQRHAEEHQQHAPARRSCPSRTCWRSA